MMAIGLTRTPDMRLKTDLTLGKRRVSFKRTYLIFFFLALHIIGMRVDMACNSVTMVKI